MNICICGGGNLGHVMAGYLAAQQGNKVSLLTRQPERWNRNILVTDIEGKTFNGTLEKVSSQTAIVIPSADLVLICLPGFAIHDELLAIKPYLSPQTIVGTVVSNTGFFFEALEVLSPSTPLFGFQRVPFISRVVEYGKSAELKGYKSQLSVAVEQTDDKEHVRLLLESLMKTPVKLLSSYYEVSLSNSNPLLHPARLYTLWKDWHDGVVYNHQPFFYADWTEEAAALYMAMDKEFQELLNALPITYGSIPDVLTYYESSDAISLTNKIKSIPAFQGILSPMKAVSCGWIPDYTHRYFTEDFPYGMRYIVETARMKGMEMPWIEKVYEWGSEVLRN